MPLLTLPKKKGAIKRLPTKRKEKESKIEDRAVKWAKEHGIEARKMNGLGFRAWPDRIFFIPGGAPVLIEFKRPGKDLTENQAYLRHQLKSIGYRVHAVDSSEAAIKFLEHYLDLK